jgi:hypothetical protein
MDEMINERVNQKENQMHATYDERIRNFEERLATATGLYAHDLTAALQGTRSSASGNTGADTTQGASGVKRIQSSETV